MSACTTASAVIWFITGYKTRRKAKSMVSNSLCSLQKNAFEETLWSCIKITRLTQKLPNESMQPFRMTEEWFEMWNKKKNAQVT